MGKSPALRKAPGGMGIARNRRNGGTMKRLLILGLLCALPLLGGVGCQTYGEPHTRTGYWAGMGVYKPPAAVGAQSISVVGMDHTAAIGSGDPVAVPPAEATVLLSQRSRLLGRSRNVAAAVAAPDPCVPDDLGELKARMARIEILLKNCLPQQPPVGAQQPPVGAQKMPGGQE
jgi:hypothetical protein